MLMSTCMVCLRIYTIVPWVQSLQTHAYVLKETKPWRNFGHLVKSYLSNALHVMNQMTDNQMISFTIRRLRSSVIFLAAFPALLRKHLKVALHFWGTGEGIYKDYVANCKFVNSTKLQHIQFLSNCVVELMGLEHVYHLLMNR